MTREEMGKDTLASIDRGMAESMNGQAISRGSFAKYVKQDIIREGIAKPICKLCGQTEELECNISEGGCVDLAECLDTITSSLHSQGVVIEVVPDDTPQRYRAVESLI